MRQILSSEVFHGIVKSVRNLLCYKYKLTEMDTGHMPYAGESLAYHAEIKKKKNSELQL
jgi:hypothetical protein